MDVRTLPFSLTLLVLLGEEMIEITIEYEGIFNECSNFFGIDHLTNKCKIFKNEAEEINESNVKSKK